MIIVGVSSPKEKTTGAVVKMSEEKDYPLKIELVPDGCWYHNLRTQFPKPVWDFIRKDAYERANGRCVICGKKTSRLEAHERWSYDEEKGVQKLVDVIAVCHDCHSAIHIERTAVAGDLVRAEDHFMKVNGCGYAEYRAMRAQANKDNRRRNGISEWKVDLTYLKRYIDEK